MKPVAIVSIIVGVGIFIQFGLGEMLHRLPRFFIDIHMTMGIVGVALIGYLAYKSAGSQIIVRAFSYLALLSGVVQVVSGLNTFMNNPLGLPESLHRMNAFILIVLVIVLGILTARSARRG